MEGLKAGDRVCIKGPDKVCKETASGVGGGGMTVPSGNIDTASEPPAPVTDPAPFGNKFIGIKRFEKTIKLQHGKEDPVAEEARRNFRELLRKLLADPDLVRYLHEKVLNTK